MKDLLLHMRRAFCRTAASLVLAGCAGMLGPDLGHYDLPPDAALDALPWPELADVPEPPPAGTFTAEVPDPQRGEALLAVLGAEAARMRARAAELAPPVLTEAERRRLAARPRHR